MLIIRLQRTGKRNQADFRIVLAEKESPVKKKITEVLGSYNPRKKDFKVKEERLKYWLGQKVEISSTVRNLLVTKSLVEGGKTKAFNIPKKEEKEAPKAQASAPAGAEADKPATEQSAPAETPAPVQQPQTPAETAQPAPEEKPAA